MSQAWVIRAGRLGERDTWALEHGFSGAGFQDFPDFTECTTKDEVAALIQVALPGASTGRIHTHTGQLWALRSRVTEGDLLVMPLKTTKQIALGVKSSGYLYRAEDPERDKRHVVRVDWRRVDLPRTAVKQDLLFTLGSALSIFAPSKNNAVVRLEHLLTHGIDPGFASTMGLPGGGGATPIGDTGTEGDVDTPELTTDIEQVAADQITVRIAEDFAGHALATLVTALLTAEGFVCTQSPPGPDGGIDVMAGRGPLGLDSPRLLAQVKSGGQIGSPVVTQLHGVMSTYGADQGLLVAWGGLSKQARDALRNQQMRVRVWEAADVVESVLARLAAAPLAGSDPRRTQDQQQPEAMRV